MWRLQANGLLEPGATGPPARKALLRLIDPEVGISYVMVNGVSTKVYNLAVDPPAEATPNGGLDTTLAIPLGTGLSAGASINIAFTFDVDHGGTFWFGYDVDAS